MQAIKSYEERIVRALNELGISTSLVTQCRLPLCGECEDLVSIGPDMFGREQCLERHMASLWQAMVAAAKDDGVSLLVVSGFRSFEYQQQIIARKLAVGLSVEQIVCISALPGFSEHHTGRAIDIGTPGSQPVSEEFEQTDAFEWLKRQGQDFKFRMTFPKDNEYGMIYEPWHWVFGGCRRIGKAWFEGAVFNCYFKCFAMTGPQPALGL